MLRRAVSVEKKMGVKERLNCHKTQRALSCARTKKRKIGKKEDYD